MLRFQRVLYASMCVLFAAAGIESFVLQLSPESCLSVDFSLTNSFIVKNVEASAIFV